MWFKFTQMLCVFIITEILWCLELSCVFVFVSLHRALLNCPVQRCTQNTCRQLLFMQCNPSASSSPLSIYIPSLFTRAEDTLVVKGASRFAPLTVFDILTLGGGVEGGLVAQLCTNIKEHSSKVLTSTATSSLFFTVFAKLQSASSSFLFFFLFVK